MANFLVKYSAGAIGGAMETINVNQEWEEKLKDKMPSETTKIIDAICQRFSNDGMLKTCKPKSGKLEPIKYMTDKSKDLITESISGDPAKTADILLHYAPTSTEIKQSGGSWSNPFGSKTKPKIDVCQLEKREEYVKEKQKYFLDGRLPELNRETAKLRDQLNKLEKNINANKRTINELEQSVKQPDKVNTLKDTNKNFQTEIEELNSTILEIDTERNKVANLIRFIRGTPIKGEIKVNKEDVESYLKQFNKDIQSLEKEFNDENNCKPEDSNETPNPINVKNVASLALDPYGTAASAAKQATGAATEAATEAAKQATEKAKETAEKAVRDAAKKAEEIAEDATEKAEKITEVVEEHAEDVRPPEKTVPMNEIGGDAQETAMDKINDIGGNAQKQALQFKDSLMGETQFDLKKNEIEDGKAETILNHYTDHIIDLLKCDEIVGETLQTKIIDTMFISINNNLKINKRELFSSIAKETTKHCIEKRIALIEPTINVYRTIVKTVPEQILSNYLHLILELFVYNCYNDLLDSEKLGFTTIDLSPDIEILKGVDGFEDEKDKLDVDSIAKIMDLNKLSKEAQIPNMQTGGELEYWKDKNEAYKREKAEKLEKERREKAEKLEKEIRERKQAEAKERAERAKAKAEADEHAERIADLPENNQFALNKFIELFEEKTEENPEEKKGGARKKYTRKRKRHHKKRRSTRRYR